MIDKEDLNPFSFFNSISFFFSPLRRSFKRAVMEVFNLAGSIALDSLAGTRRSIHLQGGLGAVQCALLQRGVVKKKRKKKKDSP